jgi:hypothetical protein
MGTLIADRYPAEHALDLDFARPTGIKSVITFAED